MRHRNIVIVSVLLLFAFSATALGQRPKITKDYDRFKDTTTIKLGPSFVQGNILNGLAWMIAGSYDGKVLTKTPEHFGFVMGVLSDEEFTPMDSTLYVIADGFRYSRESIYEKHVKLNDFIVTSPYVYILSHEDMVRLSKSRQVELRWAGLEFRLGRDQLSAIGDLLDYCTPVETY